MALDPRIILAGQQPDIVNTLDRSNIAAARANQMQDQRQMNKLYQQHGQGLVSGDRGAINALAAADPAQALEFSQVHRGNRMQDEQIAMKMAEYKRGLSAEQAAAEAEQIKRGVFMASGAQTPEEWDSVARQLGQEHLVGQFEQKDILLRQYMTAAQILEANEGSQPDYQIVDGQYVDRNNPQAGAQAVPGMQSGPDWRVATPEEAAQYGAAAGQINSQTGEFKRTPTDKSMTIESDGKGGFRFVQGADTGQDQTDPANPTSAASMLNSIEGILSDPALDTATGLLSFMQAVPGTPQRRVGARIRQLDGQAFLQAFENLKGGGQITEIEGQKATQAIGRLDSAQRTEDYVQALTELKDILSVAAQRPVGWAEQQSAAPPDMPQITDEAGYNALSSGTMFIAPDGTQRRKP